MERRKTLAFNLTTLQPKQLKSPRKVLKTSMRRRKRKVSPRQQELPKIREQVQTVQSRMYRSRIPKEFFRSCGCSSIHRQGDRCHEIEAKVRRQKEQGQLVPWNISRNLQTPQLNSFNSYSTRARQQVPKINSGPVSVVFDNPDLDRSTHRSNYLTQSIDLDTSMHLPIIDQDLRKSMQLVTKTQQMALRQHAQTTLVSPNSGTKYGGILSQKQSI